MYSDHPRLVPRVCVFSFVSRLSATMHRCAAAFLVVTVAIASDRFGFMMMIGEWIVWADRDRISC